MDDTHFKVLGGLWSQGTHSAIVLATKLIVVGLQEGIDCGWCLSQCVDATLQPTLRWWTRCSECQS
uniref:Orf22 n=1 Tax=Streptococcus pneumoniae TaxID=1313 RepID=Q9EZG6_STREE|nr:Orf22 [Streptococcus pneumoniae]